MKLGFVKVLGSLAALSFLASCGGGGDMAGDSADFAVAPKEYKLKVGPDANGGCSLAAETQPVVFTIIGGQAPFRIINSTPEGLLVDKTEATGKDPKFSVRFGSSGLCVKPGVITVLDYHSKVASVELTSEVEESTTP